MADRDIDQLFALSTGPVAEAERYLADPAAAGCALRAGDLFVAHITAGNRKTGR